MFNELVRVRKLFSAAIVFIPPCANAATVLTVGEWGLLMGVICAVDRRLFGEFRVLGLAGRGLDFAGLAFPIL